MIDAEGRGNAVHHTIHEVGATIAGEGVHHAVVCNPVEDGSGCSGGVCRWSRYQSNKVTEVVLHDEDVFRCTWRVHRGVCDVHVVNVKHVARGSGVGSGAPRSRDCASATALEAMEAGLAHLGDE